MSIKTKIMNIITAHPKLVTFSIGLTITFVIGAALGMMDHNQMANAARSFGGSGG
jgi:uncharacterized membrane protein